MSVVTSTTRNGVDTEKMFATLDLISEGRAEMVVGRGSSIEAFPLFGYDLNDYDALFADKLDLLLNVRAHEHVTWSGRFRAPLTGQGVYPRPVQERLPIWVGVGGTPESFERAGRLGVPLMVAIIGGETRRFRPLVDLYREAGRRAGHPAERLKVGMHSPAYVAETTEQAVADFLPGWMRAMNQAGRERGWGVMRREHFEAQRGPSGALLIGDPEQVTEKIARHSEALGGLAEIDCSLVEIVDLKFFCGFSFAEIAAMRGISERTVQRQWEQARIYLHRTIGGHSTL